MEEFVLTMTSIIGIYVIVGAIFSILFLWKGIVRVDKDAEGTGILFRLILVPGLLVFWPLFLIKWYKST